MRVLLSPLGNQSLKSAALIFFAMMAARVEGKFGAGFVDGFIAAWTGRG